MSPQGGRGRCRGPAGANCPQHAFHAQAAWILLRTPLKPRFWSTFALNSQTVQRFSSVPMLMRIAAQAAAIRAALLQNAKQSNDFSHFLNPETLLATSKCPCHNRCTLCRDSAPTALIHSPCAMIALRCKIGYWIPRQIQIRICSDGSDLFTLCYDGAPLRSWILDTDTDTDMDATALCWDVVLSAV